MNPGQPLGWRSRSTLIAGMLLVASCGGSTPSPTNAGTLNIVNGASSYAYAKFAAYIQPFSEATGIKVNYVQTSTSNTIPALQAQEKAGNVQWDLFAYEMPFGIQSIATGNTTTVAAFPDLFQPLDYSIVHKPADLVYPEIAGKLLAVTDVEAYPVIGSSKKAFPNGGPTTWADFFDTKKFPGPRGLGNTGILDAAALPAAALLADGVAPDQLFPLDLNRAYKKLDTIKSSVRVFWTSYTQSQDVLRSGEVVMNAMPDGRCLQLVYTSNPIACSFKGSFRSGTGSVVPKGAPHAKEAMEFINYVWSHPEKQGIFTSLTYYGPPTQAGVAAADQLGITDYSSKHIADMIPDDATFTDYVQKNSDELLKRYNAWIGD
jgi:spermidine/putrescine-binding protein